MWSIIVTIKLGNQKVVLLTRMSYKKMDHGFKSEHHAMHTIPIVTWGDRSHQIRLSGSTEGTQFAWVQDICTLLSPILQGYFIGNGTIIHLTQCWWSKLINSHKNNNITTAEKKQQTMSISDNYIFLQSHIKSLQVISPIIHLKYDSPQVQILKLFFNLQVLSPYKGDHRVP